MRQVKYNVITPDCSLDLYLIKIHLKIYFRVLITYNSWNSSINDSINNFEIIAASRLITILLAKREIGLSYLVALCN